MKKAVKILSVILLFSMIFIMISCNSSPDSTDGNKNPVQNDDEKSADSSSGGESEDGEESDTKTEIPFPYDPIDLGGATFKILTGQEWAGDNLDIEDFDIEEMDGEVLNDAIYNRNLVIKEMFNLEFETVHANEKIKNFMSKTIQSGTDEYDAVAPLLNHAGTFAQNGYAVNIYQTQLSIDAPWWDQNILGSTSIGGAAYYIAGDIFMKHYDGLPMIMFNKRLLADFGLESPYGRVHNNEWTMDKFNEMARGVYVDLDNNGKRSKNDFYGFATQCDYVISFVNGSGQLFMDKDKDDMPVFVGNTEKMASILDKMYELYGTDDTYCIHRDGSRESGNTPSQSWVFPEGRALLYWGLPRYMTLYLREMEDDFGVLPIPKWDSNQDRYYATVNGWNSYTFMLPRTVSDIERNSIVLDAMAYYGRQIIKPAYYEICLQRKYARDEESSAMLDIIFSSAHYEPGGGGSFIGSLCNDIQKGSLNMASIYEKNAGKIEKDIQDIIDAYEDAKN